MKWAATAAVGGLIFFGLAGSVLGLNHKATLLGTPPAVGTNTPGNSEGSFAGGRGVTPAVTNSPIVGPPVGNVQPPVGNNTAAGLNPSDLPPGTMNDTVLCELNVAPCP